MRAKIR